MSSATETELGALYINAHKGVKIQNILKEIRHKQSPTLMQTDNLTTEGIINMHPIRMYKSHGHEI